MRGKKARPLRLRPKGRTEIGAREFHTAVFQPSGAARDKPQRQRVKPVLHRENAGGKRLLIVASPNGHRPLGDDRACIHLLADEMDGRTGHANALFKGACLRAKAPKSGQKGRVNVELPPIPLPDKCRRMEPHETRIADEVHACVSKGASDYGVEFLPAGETLVADDLRCDARFLRADKPKASALLDRTSTISAG